VTAVLSTSATTRSLAGRRRCRSASCSLVVPESGKSVSSSQARFSSIACHLGNVGRDEDAARLTVYRSQHELIAIFKVGSAPHWNNFSLGQEGRYRTNIWGCARSNAFERVARRRSTFIRRSSLTGCSMAAPARVQREIFNFGGEISPREITYLRRRREKCALSLFHPEMQEHLLIEAAQKSGLERR
jgi:hypothetical protein